MTNKTSFLGATSDVTQLIQAAFVIAVSIGAYLAGSPLVPPPAVSVLGGMAGTIVVACLIWVWLVVRARMAGRRTDWNPGLWMKSRSSQVMVSSPTEIRYHNRIVLVAREDNQTELRWRIGWTGEGQVTPYVNNPGYRVTLEPAPADFCQILVIRFDQPVRKNANKETVVDFGVVTSARKDAPQQPFCSMTLYESRLPKEARIEVHFDEAVQVKWVLKEMYADDTTRWTLQPPERVELGPDRSVSWPLVCVRGRRYGLRWEYG